MKDNVGDYLDAIIESKFDRLEALMLYKYHQFLSLYWMLRSYSSDIKGIKYIESENNELTVTIDAGSNDNRDRILGDVQNHEGADTRPEGKNKLVILIAR